MEREHEYDLAVIGAGINGAGIARDAALRGLKVVVFDKSDLCSGTSAGSSRLIHGGLRYLEYVEIPLVYESLRERQVLRVIAAHLVKPLRISIPIYEGARRRPWLIRLGMLAYDLLSWRKKMPPHDMLSREEMLEAEPGVNADGLLAGARYFDAQVNYAERLVLENLLAARAAGASIRTWTRVTSIVLDESRISRIEWQDRLGATGSLTAAVVVNAAGPWVDQVLGVTGKKSDPLIGGTKGSHIIVGQFDGAPTDAFYVEAAADGRPFFIIPWNGQYLIGTTDIRSDEALETLRASNEEIDYLIAETNRVFPGARLSRESIHFAYAGVRPLPRRIKGPESAITRKHIIKHNRAIASNLISIIGGKLTTFRSLGEQTVDKVGRLLKKRLPECRTHDTPLPGGWGLDEARDAIAALGALSDEGAARVVSIYGGRAAQLAAVAADRPDLRRALDDARSVLAAEVVFAIEQEFAATLIDIVHRRLMIGLSADQGRSMYSDIAEIAADALDWTTENARAELDKLIAYSDSFLPV